MIKDLRFTISYWLIGLFAYLFIGLFLPIANGQTMSNEDYILRAEQFNAISGVTSGEDYKIRATTGNLSTTTVSEGVNFKIKTGFENLESPLPFSISLSSNLVNFGTLTPTNPIIRTVDLIMQSKAVYGYSVVVFENEPLTTISENKTSIPDTTCDNGKCDTENASEWTNALTYGFGYRCDNVTGIDCDSAFDGTNLYKHFPDLASNDDPQSIMAGIGANNKQIRISYKVNISGTQELDTYGNKITYIAVPNF